MEGIRQYGYLLFCSPGIPGSASIFHNMGGEQDYPRRHKPCPTKVSPSSWNTATLKKSRISGTSVKSEDPGNPGNSKKSGKSGKSGIPG